MCLVVYLGKVRKSQEVWACNFDPKGVNASCKPNPGTLSPAWLIWAEIFQSTSSQLSLSRAVNKLAKNCKNNPKIVH